jgi:hypothetical protein
MSTPGHQDQTTHTDSHDVGTNSSPPAKPSRRGHPVVLDRAALEANRALLRRFSKTMIPMLGLVLGLVTGLTILVLLIILLGENPGSGRQVLAIHLVQISVGIFLGITCLFLGSAMSWFGITGTFDIGASGGSAKINVQGAQVGIILLVGGVVLVGLSLHKSATSDYEASGGQAEIADYVAKSQTAVQTRLQVDLLKLEQNLSEAIEKGATRNAAVSDQLNATDARAKRAEGIAKDAVERVKTAEDRAKSAEDELALAKKKLKDSSTSSRKSERVGIQQGPD